MKHTLGILLILALVVAMVVTAGCTITYKIGRILENPSMFTGVEVSVNGKVGNTLWVSSLSEGAYEVEDGTGIIWVTTSEPPPQTGMQISVRGEVQTNVAIGEMQLAPVIVESKRSY